MNNTTENTSASLKTKNRERLASLSGKITIPPDEALEMLLTAALDAVEASLESKGRIVLPLEFTEGIARELKRITEPVGNLFSVTMTPQRHREIGEIALAQGQTVWEWVEAAIETAANLPEGKLPIYFDSENVRFLREVCEAAEITGGGDGVAELLISDLIEDTHRTKPGGLSTGIPELVLDTFDIPDKASAEKAMHAVIERWNANAGGAQ